MDAYSLRKYQKIVKRLKRIELKLDNLSEQEIDMAGEIEVLHQEVLETKAGIDSAIVLINGLSQYLKDHAADPAAILAYAAELDAKTNELSAAVVANPVPPVA